MPSLPLLLDRAKRLAKLCYDRIATPQEQPSIQSGVVRLASKPSKTRLISRRHQTILLCGTGLTSLILVLYVASSTILLASLRQVEVDNARQRVKGTLHILTQSKADFSDRFTDWSAWDDTYNFIQNANEDYMRANLTPATLANLKLNLALYVDTSGQIVFGTGFDLKHRNFTPIPEVIRQHLSLQDPLLQHSNQRALTGILLLPQGPMLITSQPILTSEGKGPIRGTLILGRYLNITEINKLDNIAVASVSAYTLDDANTTANLAAVHSALSPQQPIFIRPVSEDIISGYTLINDIYGQPAMLLRVDIPREIYRQGRHSLKYLATVLVLVELVFGAILLPLLKRLLKFQHDLREREASYRAVVAQASEGIFLVDAHTKHFIEVNAALQNLLGYTSKEFFSLTLDDILVPHPQTNASQTSHHPISDEIEPNCLAGEWQYRCKDRSLVDVEVSANLITYAQTDAFCIVVRDITERKRSETALKESEKRLSWQASHDSLTELANRREFEQSVEQAVVSCTHSSTQHSLFYLDLDQFKVVNDTCGHLAGDALLRQISNLFQARLRKSDVLARLGGDEFGILLYQCPLEQAIRIAELLRAEIQQLRFTWQEKTFAVTASIGVVAIAAHTQSTTDVLSVADAACYAAKNRGRNRIHVYQPDDCELLQQRQEIQWVSRLTQALEENRFRLYYQPIVPITSTKSNSEHWEILLRLEDETGNIISPMAFIPAAERYHLMHLIDRWVIATLFAQLEQQYQHFPADRLTGQPSVYAINLSGASINDEQFISFVKAQFSRFQISPTAICFEITETTAIANLAKAAQIISELKALGCQFALDDFGSGMSSFAYLKNLPVDYVKIDGVFVRDIVKDAIAAQMVEAISRIAAVMNIQTIAEFVADAEIFQKLQMLGVDYAQGYAIAPPRPLSFTADISVSPASDKCLTASV